MTCPPCTHDCNQGRNCPARNKATISTNPYRDQVIEEVALEVKKLTGFGKDTIDSLTVYIRNLKA